MAIDIKIWEFKSEGLKLSSPVISKGEEQKLQKLIESSPEIIEDDLLIIGYEYKGIDILALDSVGNSVIIETESAEIKKRETISQLIEYASKLERESPENIKQNIEEYLKQKKQQELITEVERRINKDYTQILFNPRLMAVGTTQPTADIEYMIDYLRDYGIDISWIIVQVLKPSKGERYAHVVKLVPDEKPVVSKKGERVHWTEEKLLNFMENDGGKRRREVGNSFIKILEEMKNAYFDQGTGKYGSIIFRIRDNEGNTYTPCVISGWGSFTVCFYPLNTAQQKKIQSEYMKRLNTLTDCNFSEKDLGHSKSVKKLIEDWHEGDINKLKNILKWYSKELSK